MILVIGGAFQGKEKFARDRFKDKNIFCGFEKYTKLFLQKEAKKEVNQSFIDNNEDYDSITQRDSINIVNDSTDEFIELNTNGNKI